jgi:hypothetical protein
MKLVLLICAVEEAEWSKVAGNFGEEAVGRLGIENENDFSWEQ